MDSVAYSAIVNAVAFYVVGSIARNGGGIAGCFARFITRRGGPAAAAAGQAATDAVGQAATDVAGQAAAATVAAANLTAAAANVTAAATAVGQAAANATGGVLIGLNYFSSTHSEEYTEKLIKILRLTLGNTYKGLADSGAKILHDFPQITQAGYDRYLSSGGENVLKADFAVLSDFIGFLKNMKPPNLENAQPNLTIQKLLETLTNLKDGAIITINELSVGQLLLTSLNDFFTHILQNRSSTGATRLEIFRRWNDDNSAQGGDFMSGTAEDSAFGSLEDFLSPIDAHEQVDAGSYQPPVVSPPIVMNDRSQLIPTKTQEASGSGRLASLSVGALNPSSGVSASLTATNVFLFCGLVGAVVWRKCIKKNNAYTDSDLDI